MRKSWLILGLVFLLISYNQTLFGQSETTGTIWDPETENTMCEPCQKLNNGKCVWCYDIGEECIDGSCVPFQGTIIIDDFLNRLNNSSTYQDYPDSCDVCDGLIIQSWSTTVDLITLFEGNWSSSSRENVTNCIRYSRGNLTNINKAINNIRFDINIIKQKINIVRRSQAQTPVLKKAEEKLLKLLMVREKAILDALAKKPGELRIYNQIAKAIQENPQLLIHDKQFADHQKAQDALDKKMARERDKQKKQDDFNTQKGKERKQGKQFSPNPPTPVQPPPQILPQPTRPSQPSTSDSECVNGIRVNSQAWRSLNENQKNSLLPLKAQWDGWNRDHPNQFKPYPPQWLKWFCQ